jgi:hypothetical protein
MPMWAWVCMFSALELVRMSAVTALAQALMLARSVLALVYTVTPGTAPHGVIAIMHGIVGITEFRNEWREVYAAAERNPRRA